MENDDRLLRLADVMDRVGLSFATIYRKIRAGDFPAPIHIGRASRWSAREIEAWIEAQRSDSFDVAVLLGHTKHGQK